MHAFPSYMRGIICTCVHANVMHITGRPVSECDADFPFRAGSSRTSGGGDVNFKGESRRKKRKE